MVTSTLATAVQGLFSSWVFCTALVTALLYCLWRKIWKDPYNVFEQLGIPGPRPVPYFGNALTMLWKGEQKVYERWSETCGPVCGLYIGSKPLVLVADNDMAQCIYTSNFKCFMSRMQAKLMNSRLAGLKPGLFECQNPVEWKRIRQITSSAFTSLKLKALEFNILSISITPMPQLYPPMEDSCQTLVELLKRGTSLDENLDVFPIYQTFALEISSMIVFGQVIEFQKGESADFMNSMLSVSAMCHGKYVKYLYSVPMDFLLGDKLPWLTSFLAWLGPGKYLHDFKVLKQTIFRLIRIHRNNKNRQSVLDLLLRASETATQKNDPAVELSEEQIVSHCLNFLVAAYDTTSFSLAMCSFLLATHTRVQDKLCDHLDQYWKDNPNASCVSAAHDVPYLHMVVSEALRMYPVTIRLPRTCTQSIVLGKTEFHMGQSVILPVHLFHHNKQVWGDPEVFRPERFSEEELTVTQQHHFMPFGQGPRNCIGFGIAMTEMKAALAAILHQHKFTSKDKRCEIESFAMTLYFKEPLLLGLQHRTHS